MPRKGEFSKGKGALEAGKFIWTCKKENFIVVWTYDEPERHRMNQDFLEALYHIGASE